jgi:hypothetical protein
MLAFEALPQQHSPLRTKKYWLKMAVALIVAILLTVIVTAQLTVTQVTQGSGNCLAEYPPGAYTQDVLCRSIVLNPNGLFLTGFNVPDNVKTAMLLGNYSVIQNGTVTNSATLTIWSQQEFLNHFGCKNAVPSYNREMIGKVSDNLNVTVSKGTYVILIGADSVNTEVLEAQLYLNFTV